MASENWWWLVLAILPGLSQQLRDNVFEQVVGLGELIDGFGKILRDDFVGSLIPKSRGPIIEMGQVEERFSGVFATINNLFDTVRENLMHHASRIAQTLEKDDALRPWRMFGFLFQLLFLFLFTYADIIQLSNTYTMFFTTESETVNPLFQNLTISLMVSSVGIAIAASFILADFYGLTKFGNWHDLKGGFRITVLSLVWFSLIFVIAVDAIIAVSRVTAIESIYLQLSEDAKFYLTLIPAIASNLVIIPMIIITLLFFQGFVGFAVLYIIVVWLLTFIVEIIHLVFIGLVAIFAFGIPFVIMVFVRLLTYLVIASLFLLGWAIVMVGVSVEKFTALTQAIINLLYFPMDKMIAWLASYFTKKARAV